MTDVQLIPFGNKSDKNIKIQTQYELAQGIFRLKFKVHDLLSSIAGLQLSNGSFVKTLSDKDRKDELWKQTCLEFFVKKMNHKNYFEFNVSPEGRWNLYRFTDYRSPIEIEEAITKTNLSFELENDWKILGIELDLNPLFKPGDSLLFSFSAVIKQGETVSYWAHKHSAEKPDFHHVNNFTLEVKFK
jgi:hypothetical protein